jgi:hypothetical protein
MDETLVGVMEILGPAVLLVLLVWLALRGRSNRTSSTTERGTDRLYKDEEQRRREGTDDL